MNLASQFGPWPLRSMNGRLLWSVIKSHHDHIANHAVHYRPRIKSQKTARSAVGVKFHHDHIAIIGLMSIRPINTSDKYYRKSIGLPTRFGLPDSPAGNFSFMVLFQIASKLGLGLDHNMS